MKRLIIGVIVALAFMLVPTSYAQAAHSNSLVWITAPGAGAVYNVYKQAGCTGAFVKLNTAPVITASYTDNGMADGEVNCYLITAVVTVGTTSTESLQSLSEVIRAVTPTITPGQTFVAPPGHGTVKSV